MLRRLLARWKESRCRLCGAVVASPGLYCTEEHRTEFEAVNAW